VAALQDKYMRTLAEVENLKKRHAREKTDALSYGASELLRDILPVVDNFERAMMMAKGQEGPLAQGMALIQKELGRFLETQGVTTVEALGKVFDPHVHEAMQEEVSDNVPAGQVLRVMQTGYQLRERLLRPAMVVVAKKVEETRAKEEATKEDPEAR
jgi:molecular chaperone GrpE